MTGKALTKAEKAYVRTETRLAIAGAIVRLFEDLEKEKKLNQAALADRLGVSRARVSKLVTAPGNWTLDTVADLLAAMEAKLTNVDVKLRAQIPCPNALHDWQISKGESKAESPRPYHLINETRPPVSSLQPKITQLEVAS
jgi:predicted XRE-type DNA-binding protein